ncbi:MAG: LolC: lipoprotein-releasing system transrane protein, partial [Pseudomonadota bacterium]
GIGVCALIVVLSVMDGFEKELKKRLMATDLHVLATPAPGVLGFERGRIPIDQALETRLRDWAKSEPSIEQIWPILSTEAILKSGRKVNGVIVKGVSEGRLDRLKQTLSEFADPAMMSVHEAGETVRLPGIFLGRELAHELGIVAGDQVTLISPTETEGPLGSVPRLKRFVVEGIYRSGMPEQELHVAFASMRAVQAFLRRNDVISQIELTLTDFERAPVIAERLAKWIPGWQVQDWVQMNSHLFASLRLERFAMFTVLAFIVVVASFNIVTTLTLMVLEKRREISILKTMGARHSQVAAIFLAEGLGIGLRGVLGGGLLGVGLCFLLKRYEFIELPDVFYDRTLPVSFQPAVYVLIGGVTLLIVLLACQYPCRRALKLTPLQGIRLG